MKSVFICYVRDNKEAVVKLYSALKSNGINVWMDLLDLKAGERWERRIREEIQTVDFFIPCFSKEYNARETTYMNEELKQAIEVLRRRSPNKIWCIPVKLNECDIPDDDIGGGETWRSFHYVNLSEDWEGGIQRICETIQPESFTQVPDTTDVNQVSQEAVEAFSKGDSCQNRARESTDPEVKQEEYKNAIRHYTRAIQLQPDYAEARKKRGDTYREQGQMDTALEDYKIAIQLRPNYTEAYKNRGRIYHEKGELDLAIEDYTEVITLQPDYAEAYNERGEAYRKQGNFDFAIEDYNRAIERKSDYAEAYDNRGRGLPGQR